jgi:aryl-alcohol dehydrogenase-like predicted oxidoreductase
MEQISRRNLLLGCSAALGTLPFGACERGKNADGSARLTALAARAGALTLGEDLTVNRLGFGTSSLGWQSGAGLFRRGIQHPEDARRLLRRAVELGVQLIDTADTYGRDDESEPLIYQALHPYPSNLVIATKGGLVDRSPDGFERDASPAHLRTACEASLARLHLERIDLYQLHWVDPKVPMEESVGELARLRTAGKIRHIGLSNVSLAELQRAQAIAPVVSVQNRYNVSDRASDDVLGYCERVGLAFLPWAPLRGGENPAQARLAELATRRGLSVQQAMLAWLLARSRQMLPIPGTTSVEHLEQDMAAAGVVLTSAEMAAIG